MPKEEAEEFANSFHMPFLETSAKASMNVDEAFVVMTKEIKDKMQQKQVGSTKASTTTAPLGQGKAVQRPESTDESTDDGRSAVNL